MGSPIKRMTTVNLDLSFVSKLNTYADRNQVPRPRFVTVDFTGPSHNPNITVRLEFLGHTVTATANSLRGAKLECLRRILPCLPDVESINFYRKVVFVRGSSDIGDCYLLKLDSKFIILSRFRALPLLRALEENLDIHNFTSFDRLEILRQDNRFLIVNDTVFAFVPLSKLDNFFSLLNNINGE